MLLAIASQARVRAGAGSDSTQFASHAWTTLRRVATAAISGKAQVWDVAAGRVVAVLRGHANYVVSAAFSPDGKCAITGSHDRTARVWEVPQA